MHTAQKDKASQAFVTKIQRDEFTIEQLKYSIIADLHTLEGMVGHEQARKWLSSEFVQLPF